MIRIPTIRWWGWGLCEFGFVHHKYPAWRHYKWALMLGPISITLDHNDHEPSGDAENVQY